MSKETKKKVYIVTIAIFVAAVVLTIATSGFHHKPGYYVLFGFVGAWILILFSKRLLGPLLQKDENYYGEAEEPETESVKETEAVSEENGGAGHVD